ncbi:MAG: GtrA family protein [Myxococcales bacterium]|nr:GtrA family protein [Myxococcales bacterium]
MLDLAVGLVCLHVAGLGTRWGAMAGVAVGAAFTFFANRYFAFREHNPNLAKPALKFLLTTALAMLAHGQLVVFMRDGLGVPFLLAKLAADLCVFTFGQLLLLRFVVFPRPVESGLPALAEQTGYQSLQLEREGAVELPRRSSRQAVPSRG